MSRRNSSTLPSATSLFVKSSPVHRVSFKNKFVSPEGSGATEMESNYAMAQEAATEVAKMIEAPPEISPGIPFTQALESKGLARRSQTSAGFSSHKPNITSQLLSRGVIDTDSPNLFVTPSSLREELDGSDDEHVYELPPDCMLSTSPTSSFEFPDHYDKPRSWTTAVSSSAFPIMGSRATVAPGPERARILDNGYMVPRLLLQQTRHIYDYVPSSRPADGGKVHRSALLQEATSTGTSPSSMESPHEYINVQQLAEGGVAPPPIDRSTKPVGPAVDRSLKPDRRTSEPMSVTGYDIADGETSPLEDSLSPSDFSVRPDGAQISEEFVPTDLPRLTSRSVRYTQVAFEKSKKPVPKPRSNAAKTSPPKLRVNYTDIDISATATGTEEGTAANTRHYTNMEGVRENTSDTDQDFYMEDGPDQMFTSPQVGTTKHCYSRKSLINPNSSYLSTSVSQTCFCEALPPL